MITMDSPDERKTKLVLVSINWSDGGTSWRLVTATKVGRSYQIDESALYEMQRMYWRNDQPRTDADLIRSLQDLFR